MSNIFIYNHSKKEVREKAILPFADETGTYKNYLDNLSHYPAEGFPAELDGCEVQAGVHFNFQFQVPYDGTNDFYSAVYTAIPLATGGEEKPKFYAVEYAGFWNIQTDPNYGEENILDVEEVGEKEAEQYANLIAKLLNEYYGS